MQREIKAHIKRRETRDRELAWHAWTTAHLGRVVVEHFPKSPAALLKASEAKPQQTLDQQLAIMKSIFVAFGGNPEQLEGQK